MKGQGKQGAALPKQQPCRPVGRPDTRAVVAFEVPGSIDVRKPLLPTALLVGFLAALSFVRLLERGRDPDVDPARSQAPPRLAEASTPLELAEPPRIRESSGIREEARAVPDPPASDEAARTPRSRKRAPIRGRLLIAGTEDVLDEVLSVRLRAGDLSVKETVESAADGSFTSKRPFPRGYVLAEVLRPAGDPATDHEGYFDPAADAEWLVSVPWPNLLRGRLVDRAGRPLNDIELRLAQGGVSERRTTKSDGGFAFSGLGLGHCRLTVRRGFEHHEISAVVVRGPNELGDIVVPFRERVGPIRGRLRSELGTTAGSVVLTDLAHGNSYEEWINGNSNGVAEFEFADVPSGDYRLTLLASDGQRYDAPTRLVRPPATDIEFVARGTVDPLVFRLQGREEELESASIVLSSGLWCDLEVAGEAADVERWVCVPAGHRPVSGGTPESARIDVRLEPGWGRALVFAEVGGGQQLGYDRGRPLAGVEVLADGVPVGWSDEDGLVLVSLAREPEALEYHLVGWRVRDEDTEGAVCFVKMTRD